MHIKTHMGNDTVSAEERYQNAGDCLQHSDRSRTLDVIRERIDIRVIGVINPGSESGDQTFKK